MAGRQKLSTGRKWGEELLKTYDLQPYETTPSNSVLPVLNPNFIQADAQPRQVTVSGILQGAIDEQIISPVAGSNTEIQYNASGVLGASADLTWDDTGKELGVGGDINLDDGGTYSTTLQVVTPTANRTISFPDATGTVALVAGSSSQVLYNNAGALAGGNLAYDSTAGTFGYGTGRGTVTQTTNKSTGVTLNAPCGAITTHNEALASGTTVNFVLTNSSIAANDLLMLNHISGGTAGSYLLNAQAAAGSGTINVRNITDGSLSEAIVIGFAVLKS